MMLFVASAPALSVKVLAVDVRKRTIAVLLPMHNTHIEDGWRPMKPNYESNRGASTRQNSLAAEWTQLNATGSKSRPTTR